MRVNLISFLIFILSFSAFAQNKTEILNAANGQTYNIAGRDRQRGDNEIVVYAPEFYAKKPTPKNGVDVYVTDGKVAVIQDRAGAVYLQNKPDPGAIKVGKRRFCFQRERRSAKMGSRQHQSRRRGFDRRKQNRQKRERRSRAGSFDCHVFRARITAKPFRALTFGRALPDSSNSARRKSMKIGLTQTNNQPLDNFSVYMGGNAGGKYGS